VAALPPIIKKGVLAGKQSATGQQQRAVEYCVIFMQYVVKGEIFAISHIYCTSFL